MRLRDIFATNLWRARDAAKLTQDELADLAGIDRSYISELENAKYSASIDMIESLSGALGISAELMLRPEGIPLSAKR